MNISTLESLAVACMNVEDTAREHLETQTFDYQHTYALRRSVSTMAMAAREHLSASAKRWAADSRSQQRPFRILSVGCGDGDLDLAILQGLVTLAEVDYLGLEVNPISAQLFREALDECKLQAAHALKFEIRIETAQTLPQIGEGFDLVLMSHVLYYFADPAALVQTYLHQACRIDGRLVIVHSGWEGIPRLMSEVPGLTPFLCAEEIRDALVKNGLRVDTEMIETALDVAEILEQTHKGEQVLGFCVEREIDQITPSTRKHLLKAFWGHCQILEDGAWLREPLAVMVLRNDLGVAPPRKPESAARSSDPIEDYHRLAQSFNWPARLQAQADDPVRVLDIGCGRGRWLKVLHRHWPALASARDDLEYSAIDPSAAALAQAREQSQAWARWGQGWSQKIEDIEDLPLAHYDIAWSLHSLYCVARADLAKVLSRIAQSLKPEGLAVIALPDRQSFYITAAERLADQDRFTCAEDVCEVLTQLGLAFEVRQLDYEEVISANDDQALRTYVWQESIGNSYSTESGADELPALPGDAWFESHRRQGVFAFAQNVRVITFRGGQRLLAARTKLQPDPMQMRAWAKVASDVGIAEHAGLAKALVIEPLITAEAPSWVHQTKDGAAHERVALGLYARLMRDPLPEWGDGNLQQLLQNDLLPLLHQGTRDNAPGYMGYIPSGGLYLGALAEWLAAVFNRYSAMFMAAPGSASIEALCIRWLTELTGLQTSASAEGLQAGGVLVSGASMATVTAVHAARHKALAQGQDSGTLVAYFGNTVHGCVAQALSVCGIAHVRSLAVGADHRVDMQVLAQAMDTDRQQGLSPFLIALSAGEVQTGAIDDLAGGRQLADQHRAWLHVDGAYGGFFAMTRSAPARLQEIRLANSLALDPHKGMGLPYGTGALLVRDVNDLRRAFANQDDYLPPTPEMSRPADVMDLGIEMTRPFRGLRLWLPIRLLGIAPFRDHLEHMLELARWLAAELRSIPELELLSDPDLSICCFRLRAPASEAHNRQLLDEINTDGRFFITGCTLAVGPGGFALRVALLSFRTDRQTVEALARQLRAAVGKVLR